jgi:flagellar L-ring protein precursor FlgH
MKLVLIIGILLAVSLGAAADPIQPRGGSIFADPVASKPGDVVLVLIKDVTTVAQKADTENQRSGQMSLFGLGNLISQFFPSSLDNSSHTGSRTNDDHEQKFESTLTTTVKSVTSTGNLVIEGQRMLVLNGQRQELRLSGEVRPLDLGADNTVPSNRITNLQIDYKGPLKGYARKGLIQWVLEILY